MLTIENVIPKIMFAITGDVTLHEGSSTSGLPSAAPVNIVQRDQDVILRFKWSQSGWLGLMLAPGCRWELRVYLEKFGLGEVANPPAVNIGFVPGLTGNYSNAVTIPNGTLPEGAYKIVATLMLRGPGGNPTPIAAFKDLGILQVYQDF